MTSFAKLGYGWLVAYLLAGPMLARALGAQVPAHGVREAIADMEGAAGGRIRTVASEKTDLVIFLGTELGKPIKGRLSAADPAQDRATDFLDRFGRAFGIDDPSELSLSNVSAVDEVGLEHVRFRQTYRGVPVTGGEVMVHLRGADVVSANAKVLDDLGDIDVQPRVSVGKAAALATQAITEQFGKRKVWFSDPRLEILNRGLLGERASATRLAWFVEARALDLREYLWLDAASGKILLQFSQLTDAKDRQVYDADDPGDGVFNDLPGILVRDEGDPATGDSDVDSAYDFAGDTYDYFFNEHGRDSYDDAGATIVSSVHFCSSSTSCPMVNAFWNGIQMVYGEGFSAADDVVAHELTHAVTERTANLFYYMQSGALNESYSDIFGETVDLLNGDAGTRWDLGEDIPGIGAIRDMDDPTVFNDPGKVSDPEFICNGGGFDPAADRGGVHQNSGVPNHAYALMVDGGSYNGFSITGIGLTKAGKIQYRALSTYLLSASDFLDNYNALNQSCQDLIGTVGITAGDCTEVTKALDAVEMASTWPCTPPTQAATPDLCSPGSTASVISLEDFSSGAGLSPCPTATAPTAWCWNDTSSVLGPFATSGTASAWGYNRPTKGNLIREFVASNPLAADAWLQFNHSFGFENTFSNGTYWDGGVLEYSTNGGSTWTDAGSLIVDGQSYSGNIRAGGGPNANPLAGQSAFVGESWGFTATQMDLSSLAATDFRLRFNIGTDGSVDDYGWFIDDLVLYTCETNICVADLSLTSADNGSAMSYSATNTITAGSGFAVGGTETVDFSAGTSIILENDFSVASGGQFTARLDGCP